MLVAFLCNVIWSGCGTYSYSLFVRPLQADFEWSRAGIMAGFTIMLITMGLSSPAVGKAADRLGPKRVILMGAGILGLGFVWLSLMNSLWQFYAGYVLTGIGIASMGQVPLTMVVSSWFRQRRGLAIGIMASGIGVGGLGVAPVLGGYLIPGFGWRAGYLTFGLLTWGIVIPLVFFVVKEKPGGVKQDSNDDEVKGPVGISAILNGRTDIMTLGKALLTSAFWLIAGSFMLSQFSGMGTIQSQVPHLQDIGFPIGTAAAALGGIGLVSAVSKVGFGWLCDRINPKHACAIGIALQAGGTFILMSIQPVSSPFLLWVYILVFGLGLGHWLPVVSMLVSTNFGLTSYGAIFGVVILFLNTGTSLGPLVAGRIYDMSNTYVWAFTLFIGINLIAIMAVMAVRRPKTI
ncbi:MAG: MFS transporter [Pseudomonadota bacterium]